MEIVTADIGNAQIKGKWNKSEEVLEHAIAELRPDEWDSAMRRSREQHDDLIMVNGVPFMVGQRADNYVIRDRLTGAARYTRDYYGVLGAILMARIFKRSVDDVFFFGSYPPGDIQYQDDLLHSIAGEWYVLYRGEELYFNVTDGSVFEEPYGGLMNIALKSDGRLNEQFRSLADSISLVIDIGGHTTDTVRIEKNGYVDEQSAQSINLGILRTIHGFEDNIRANNAKLLKGVPLSADVLREALRTGKLNLRGYAGYLDVKEEADIACNKVVNSVSRVFDNTYGGPAQFDAVILTGGGGALLESRLKKMLNHRNIILAEKRGKMHLANVRGGDKLARLYRRNGGL